MSKLKTTQQQFQQYLLSGDDKIASAIATSANDSQQVRLGVYQTAYQQRLLGILQSDFERTEMLLGKPAFEQLALKYIAAHPSRYFSICDMGQHFSDFVKQQSNIKPEYGELCEFEWQLETILTAADGPQLTVDELLSLTPEQWQTLTLTLHPSVVELTFHYNVVDICAAFDANEKLPDIQYQDQETHWLLWRNDQQAHYQSLSQPEHWMLQAFHNQLNFSEICLGLCEFLEESEVGHYAATTLRSWVEEGIFSHLN